MSYPIVTVNRILKRLSLHGQIKAIPRERDKTFIYTLADSPIKEKNPQINHHLKIVDVYIKMKCPQVFDVERTFGIYEPDVYTIDQEQRICIELQLTQISSKKMNMKLRQFKAESNKHGSRILYLISNHKYLKLDTTGIRLIQLNVPEEVIIKNKIP